METLKARGQEIGLTRNAVLDEIKKLREMEDPVERDRQAFFLSMRLKVPTLIDILHELMGYREIADLAGVMSERSVRNWTNGIRRPKNSAVEDNLRLAFRISANVYNPENPDSVKSWFKSPNPSLGGATPIETLRRKNLMARSSHGREVLAAARSLGSSVRSS